MSSELPTLPLLTAIIPVRNERAYVRACLYSILSGTYPADRLEIIVVDGESNDGTHEVLEEIVASSRSEASIRIMDNPYRTTPHALNAGLAAARGELVAILGAHATYEPRYLEVLARGLDELGCSAVGALVRTAPGSSSAMSEAIAISLGHPFGIGPARYKRSVTAPTEVGTIAFACYRRSTLLDIGSFDTSLTRGQDLDLNVRLGAAGGKLFMVPGTHSTYFSRTGLWNFIRYRYLSGFWLTWPLSFGKSPFRTRHLVPAVFVLTLLLSLSLRDPSGGGRPLVGTDDSIYSFGFSLRLFRSGPLSQAAYGIGPSCRVFGHASVIWCGNDIWSTQSSCRTHSASILKSDAQLKARI